MKSLTLLLTLPLCLFLSACGSESIYELEEVFSLDYDETATVNMSAPTEIKFTSVVDSRCPLDAMCFWAGAVTTTLSLTYDNTEFPIDLSLGLELGDESYRFGDSDQYTVELLSVTLNDPLEADEYSAELIVHFDPRACAAIVAPQCGLKTVTCITEPCQPIYETFSNSCVLELEGADFAFEGECGAIEGASVPVVSDDPVICTLIFDPVCGIVGTEIDTYSNSCMAAGAGALAVPDELCGL